MPLPYRTILRLPAGTDSIRLAEQEVETWLAPKIGRKYRNDLESGRFFGPGIHHFGEHQTLAAARVDRSEDNSRRLLLRWTELTSTGTWEVQLTAIDFPSGGHRSDTLVIEARRADDPDAPGEVDPPRIVRQLLEREAVFDGQARVTSEPLLVNADDVDEVFDAIVDEGRSVSVIVATSLGREYDASLRDRIRQLTAKVVGVAAVFFLTQEAAQALNDQLPSSHQIEPGRVRTFLPAVDLDDPWDGRRHRVLSPASFARAIHGRGVSGALQAAYAIQTRGALLQRPLPADVRRSVAMVTEALARLGRDELIEQRATAALVAEVAPAPRRSSLLDRVRQVVARWLRRDAELKETDLDELDSYIAKQVATAETMLEEAASLEDALSQERDARSELQGDRDGLELELAEAQDDATDLRRKVEFLQSRLVAAGQYDDAYTTPDRDVAWTAPSSISELVEMLTAGSGEQHQAFARVEFTGDLGAVEEVQKRDQVGRYTNAFWEYVQVLYDYVGQWQAGFRGSVHMYLTDDRVTGKKCSPTRHAPKESESVLSRDAWRNERVLPVPTPVSPDGRVLMEAHFRPTHQDTFAPRMHYYDDTAGTGKIYIGYIGKHLTNLQTSDC
ncbi:MAG: hypothetical protein LCH96_12975 [Actinobacteria bacterium]|nr:hypothetical protein [Actinomycetota bacterium]